MGHATRPSISGYGDGRRPGRGDLPWRCGTRIIERCCLTSAAADGRSRAERPACASLVAQVDHRIRMSWALRPQLMRDPLGGLE
jgi:hypothetical protein